MIIGVLNIELYLYVMYFGKCIYLFFRIKFLIIII